MRIALITDTHWGVRGDSKDFLEHQIKFYKDIFFPELKKRGIKTIIHLGDIVDRRKYINFMTLNALRKHFIEIAGEMGIEIHAIVGNHDIPLRETNSINALDETFQRYDFVHTYSNPEEVLFDDLKILMMPWISNTSLKRDMEIINKTDAQVLFGHLEIKGFEMYKGLPSHDGFDPTIFDKFDVVASGHFHKKSTRGNINYLGAPYQMTWGDYNCPRGFHVFDTDTREFEYIQNPYKMFHKVIYDDTGSVPKNMSHLKGTFVKVIVKKKTQPVLFETWIVDVYNEQPLEVTIIEDQHNIEVLSDEDVLESVEDTPTILTKYVYGLETSVDKKKLDNLLKSLYHEALDIN